MTTRDKARYPVAISARPDLPGHALYLTMTPDQRARILVLLDGVIVPSPQVGAADESTGTVHIVRRGPDGLRFTAVRRGQVDIVLPPGVAILVTTPVRPQIGRLRMRIGRWFWHLGDRMLGLPKVDDRPAGDRVGGVKPREKGAETAVARFRTRPQSDNRGSEP